MTSFPVRRLVEMHDCWRRWRSFWESKIGNFQHQGSSIHPPPLGRVKRRQGLTTVKSSIRWHTAEETTPTSQLGTQRWPEVRCFDTFTISFSHIHFHTFNFPLSLSHFRFHTFTFTLSLSHSHFHTFTFTLSGLRRAKVPMMVYSCGGFSRCFRVCRFYDVEVRWHFWL